MTQQSPVFSAGHASGYSLAHLGDNEMNAGKEYMIFGSLLALCMPVNLVNNHRVKQICLTWHGSLKQLITSASGSMGEMVVKVLPYHQCGPCSDPKSRYIWVEVVVGSRVTPRVFLRILRSSFFHKNQHLQISI